MAGLTLRGLRKSFGAVDVIKGVDLDVADKEFVVFVGPSGCGKSTLLRMIAGLETITAGDLHIGGVRMNDVDPSRRGTAMVFQSYALYPHMTVRENMGFALKFAGQSKAQIAAQVDQAARILALEPLLDRLPKQLSGGQRQRVAIGRAIVRQPEVFLFDEPLSNLDAELRVHMRVELARLHKDLETTIIHVTHDQVEAMTLADKIVVMRDGRIEQVGKPLDLYDDPANAFVAGFIGSPRMNMLQATAEAGGLRLRAFPDTLVPHRHGLAQGTEVTVGLRPEHFRSDGPLRLQMQVDLVEHLGGETFAYGRSDGEAMLVVGTGSDRSVQAGDTLQTGFNENAILAFDTSGLRLRQGP